jgi:hypothetical protein
MPPPPRDWMGWALLGAPALASILQLISPWTTLGTVIGYGGLLANVVLVGVDASRHKQRGARYVVGAFFLWMIVFPIYMRRRAYWGAPNRLGLAILTVILFLVSCFFHPFAIQDRATVRCDFAGKTLDEGFDCTLEKTSGSNSVEICWDLTVSCDNGAKVTGEACGRVLGDPSEYSIYSPRHVPMPYATLGHQGPCDKVASSQISNINVRVERSPSGL